MMRLCFHPHTGKLSSRAAPNTCAAKNFHCFLCRVLGRSVRGQSEPSGVIYDGKSLSHLFLLPALIIENAIERIQPSEREASAATEVQSHQQRNAAPSVQQQQQQFIYQVVQKRLLLFLHRTEPSKARHSEQRHASVTGHRCCCCSRRHSERMAGTGLLEDRFG